MFYINVSYKFENLYNDEKLVTNFYTVMIVDEHSNRLDFLCLRLQNYLVGGVGCWCFLPPRRKLLVFMSMSSALISGFGFLVGKSWPNIPLYPLSFVAFSYRFLA